MERVDEFNISEGIVKYNCGFRIALRKKKLNREIV